ncbi:MAG: hypothetical protein AB7H90_01825 [Alphaproteobacteria bacterium]
MTADTIGAGGHGTGSDSGAPRDMTPGSMTRGGIAASAALHVVVAALVVFGVPNLFRKPPPQDMPIAVQLVTIAPQTRATTPNPFRPRPDAKPEPPLAQPAPVPEPKPEPPAPSPAPPPSAAATPVPPPPPTPEAKPVPPAPPPVAKAEPKPLPAPPPPPKPVEARASAVPPPLPERKPKPKPEPRPVQQARAETKPDPKPKPEPQRATRAEPKTEVKPESRKVDPAAFSKLLQDLETREKEDQPDAFDSLLKNLTRQQTARTEEPTPAPRRMASLSPPSAQPKAPLGTELTASEIDIVRQQLSRCWNIPAGARDARDLVVTIRGTIAPDGRVLQADIVDKARLGDPFFRAAAESARRAFFHPHCRPLRLPPEKYESWKTFEIALSPKDIL